MNKIVITALLLCTGLGIAGCEKTYSVEEFKKDHKLLDEWGAKCEKMGPSSFKTSKNCKNAQQAYVELFMGR